MRCRSSDRRARGPPPPAPPRPGAGSRPLLKTTRVGACSPPPAARRRAARGGPDAAPRGAVVGAVGPASSDAVPGSGRAREPLPLLLLAAIGATLLAETASRRLRGER